MSTSQPKLVSAGALAIFHAALALGALSLVGCDAGSEGRPGATGGAGMGQGQAGTTGSGAAGSGAAGQTTTGEAGQGSGAAGSGDQSGAAGSGSGQAGGGPAGASGSAGVTGSAGTNGAAGATGAAGTNGAAGTTGTAGATGAAGTGGGTATGNSTGCGQPPTDTIGKATMHSIMVTSVAAKYPTSVNRKYYTTLPQKYDPMKPYPVVFYGPGCGATGSEGSSFTTGHFLTDIIYVQGVSVTGCFQAGKSGTADSPDGPYFDMAIAETMQHNCVDKSRIFAAGTSSGAWLSNYLACARGNVIRGIAADSGGLQFDHGTCTGGAAVMEMPGDETTDTVNGHEIGVANARDLFIKANGCSMTSTGTMTFGAAAGCMMYGNCASPVVWCNVGGSHQSGAQKIAEASWAFWSTLK
jgi:hypothetical protein